jgi:hypothetical protein
VLLKKIRQAYYVYGRVDGNYLTTFPPGKCLKTGVVSLHDEGGNRVLAIGKIAR